MIKSECTSLKKCILDKNDTYIYFEMIRRIEPSSVIDIGMFLKRIGAITRQVMDVKIEETIKLTGVDLMPELQIAVYHQIYDTVWDLEKIIKSKNQQEETTESYEMAILLGVEQWMEKEDMECVWNWVSQHSLYILTDTLQGEVPKRLQQTGKVREITVEKKTYYLLII